ncbi:MAG: ABC transporter permease [Chitinophagaceae bacterium]
MLQNFLKIAWRNSTRQLRHTIISIASLVLGTICCIFIFLWVRDEKSIDNFHENGVSLYTMYETTTGDGKVTGAYNSPLKFDSAKPAFIVEGIKEAVPEVSHFCFYATGYELPWGHPETFRAGEKMLKMEGARAGEDFFKMFSYPLIEGRPEDALRNRNGIAISRKMADIFFGSPAKAMNQALRYEDKLDFLVTAVFEDISSKSSLHFDFLFNWEAQKNLLDWASPGFQTYIQLKDGADPVKVENKINNFLKPHLKNEMGVTVRAGLQPFGEQYLQNVFVGGKPRAGRIEYVRIFSGIAIFILIIACINFMNLNTARSVKRAKEVGLRKVVGAGKGSLIFQFMGESLLFTAVAILISLAFVYGLLPVFDALTGKHMSIPVTESAFWGYLAVILLATSVISGSYPAIYLSSLRPVTVLKGKGVASFSGGAALFRKGLTVFQFVLSITLIIATIVIIRQTSFLQNTHLGYDKENLLYIRIEGELANGNKYLLFKQQLMKRPGIAYVDRSSEAPHSMGFTVTDPVKWEGKPLNAAVGFKPASVGYDFVKLMHLRIAEGRDFSSAISTDSTDAFLVNEEAVKEMRMTNPIGKWISAWGKRGHIVGVLKDYHINSLREQIQPLVIDIKEGESFGVIIIRTGPGQTTQALAGIADVYKKLNPDYPFSYQFVDEEYAKLYRNEQLISRLTVVFGVLAILISCLGLLGLVMFAAGQRTKEMGVRKVLGATFIQIITLFSKDFLKLVLIAFVIGAPVAWAAMDSWLRGFAYRVTIPWWIYLLAAGISLIIAIVTISYQSVMVARANPVKSLRTE